MLASKTWHPILTTSIPGLRGIQGPGSFDFKFSITQRLSPLKLSFDACKNGTSRTLGWEGPTPDIEKVLGRVSESPKNKADTSSFLPLNRVTNLASTLFTPLSHHRRLTEVLLSQLEP
jgi:hypothetical protein